VIGPVRLNRSQGEAPRLLEHGGPATQGSRRVVYAPRPYMGPAFEKEHSQLPDMWRNSVSK
jgi:hypothetical protein